MSKVFILLFLCHMQNLLGMQQLANYVKTKLQTRDTNRLLEAARTGDESAFNKIVTQSRHVNIHGTDDDGRTAVHLAAKEGYASMIKRLQERGAPLDATDNHGNTPLHLACQYAPRDLSLGGLAYQKATIYHLIDCKVNLNAQNNSGDTPLHLFLKHLALFCKGAPHIKQPETVLLHLVYCGARLDILNNDGFTPLNCMPTSRECLQKALTAAIENGNNHNIAAFLAQGYPVHEVLMPYASPLTIAARANNQEAACILLDNNVFLSPSLVNYIFASGSLEIGHTIVEHVPRYLIKKVWRENGLMLMLHFKRLLFLPADLKRHITHYYVTATCIEALMERARQLFSHENREFKLVNGPTVMAFEHAFLQLDQYIPSWHKQIAKVLQKHIKITRKVH